MGGSAGRQAQPRRLGVGAEALASGELDGDRPEPGAPAGLTSIRLVRFWKYGEPGMDHSKRPLNPDFVLNQPRYRGATVLLARENFGCGSSREHAPWALLQYGFQAVIAPSFADIFYNNSLKNGLLLIKLDAQTVDRLFREVACEQGLPAGGRSRAADRHDTGGRAHQVRHRSVHQG